MSEAHTGNEGMDNIIRFKQREQVDGAANGGTEQRNEGDATIERPRQWNELPTEIRPELQALTTEEVMARLDTLTQEIVDLERLIPDAKARIDPAAKEQFEVLTEAAYANMVVNERNNNEVRPDDGLGGGTIVSQEDVQKARAKKKAAQIEAAKQAGEAAGAPTETETSKRATDEGNNEIAGAKERMGTVVHPLEFKELPLDRLNMDELTERQAELQEKLQYANNMKLAREQEYMIDMQLLTEKDQERAECRALLIERGHEDLAA